MLNDILLSSGIPDLPIELAAYKLEIKASSGYESNHPFKLKDVINLFEAIANPIAVFDSKTKAGCKIILTELNSNGNNFVVSMQINAHPNGYRSRIEINDVRSVYPKDNVRDVVSWINRGDLLRWSDKTNLRNWLTQQQSNSAEVAIPISEINVATKIIESFVNPTLLYEKIFSEEYLKEFHKQSTEWCLKKITESKKKPLIGYQQLWRLRWSQV